MSSSIMAADTGPCMHTAAPFWSVWGRRSPRDSSSPRWAIPATATALTSILKSGLMALRKIPNRIFAEQKDVFPAGQVMACRFFFWTYYNQPCSLLFQKPTTEGLTAIKLIVDSDEAVSYTHLDVYKRQSLWWDRGVFLKQAEKEVGQKDFSGKQLYVAFATRQRPNAVSYTHLPTPTTVLV